MNRNLAKFLEKLTRKKVIMLGGVMVSHNGETGKSELRRLANEMRKWKWQDRKFLKSGKKLNIITTSDLDQEGKLYPNYLERRKRREKKEENSPMWGRKDWR